MALLSTVADVDSTVEQALAGAPNVGWYRFRIANERWEWSPEVEISGYRRVTAEPTTGLVLSPGGPSARPAVV
jgi:hypothetical protein